MIKHNGEYYGWNAVYLISGLVQEDFLHDSVGELGTIYRGARNLEAGK